MTTIPLNLTSLSPWGIVTLFVLLIAFGMLIPVSLHKQRMADKDKQISYLEALANKRDEQLSKLLETNELIIRLLEELKTEARRR